MGWLRLVGSLKLHVSFAKEPYKRDYILLKRPIILRSLLIDATPYQSNRANVATFAQLNWCIYNVRFDDCHVGAFTRGKLVCEFIYSWQISV